MLWFAQKLMYGGLQTDGQEKRGGSPGGSEDPQPPVALRYNTPSVELGVQLQAARPGGGGAIPAPEDGASSLMHAASRPALLGLDGSGGSPQSLRCVSHPCYRMLCMREDAENNGKACVALRYGQGKR